MSQAASLRRDGAAAGARARLLDAAEKLFAERGYQVASVRNITAEAGCNVAAVNYHFGGKLSLYREMFQRRLRTLREQRIAGTARAMEEAGDRASLEALLRAFTIAFLEPHLDRSRGRRFMHLMSRELLDPHLRPGTFQRQMIEPVQEMLTRWIVRICPCISARSARRCVHSLIAQLVHVARMRHAPGLLKGVGAGDFTFPQAAQHIVRFTAAGIRGCAG